MLFPFFATLKQQNHFFSKSGSVLRKLQECSKNNNNRSEMVFKKVISLLKKVLKGFFFGSLDPQKLLQVQK